jgi:hypothetical protein
MSKGPATRGAHRSSSRRSKAKTVRCASSQNHRNSVGEPTVLRAATYLDELNPEQRRAVEHGVRQGCTVGPPLLVIAGAGSGKTVHLHLNDETMSALNLHLATFQ